MREDEPWLPWEIDHRQDRGDAEFFYSVLVRIPGALPSTTEAISSRVGFLVLPKRALHAAELRRGVGPAPARWWAGSWASVGIRQNRTAGDQRRSASERRRLGC